MTLVAVLAAALAAALATAGPATPRRAGAEARGW